MADTVVLNGVSYSVRQIDGEDVIVIHSGASASDVIEVSQETLAKVFEARSYVSESVNDRGFSRRHRPKKPKRWERKYR